MGVTDTRVSVEDHAECPFGDGTLSPLAKTRLPTFIGEVFSLQAAAPWRRFRLVTEGTAQSITDSDHSFTGTFSPTLGTRGGGVDGAAVDGPAGSAAAFGTPRTVAPLRPLTARDGQV